MQADRCPPVVGMPEPWPPRTAEQEAATAAFWTMVCDNEDALAHMTTLSDDLVRAYFAVTQPIIVPPTP